jgi:hypothetical protein
MANGILKGRPGVWRGRGVVVGAGVGQQVADGLGGGVGDGGVDGDLVFVPVVDGLDVEGGQEPFGQASRRAGEDVAQVR